MPGADGIGCGSTPPVEASAQRAAPTTVGAAMRYVKNRRRLGWVKVFVPSPAGVLPSTRIVIRGLTSRGPVPTGAQPGALSELSLRSTGEFQGGFGLDTS